MLERYGNVNISTGGEFKVRPYATGFPAPRRRALHVVDVVRHPSNGAQRIPDLRIAATLLLEVFHDVPEEEVVLEDALDRLEEIRAEGECVSEGQLPPTEGPHGRLPTHELRQYRHRPGTQGASQASHTHTERASIN